MRIGFDAKRLFFNHTGLGNYSRTLVSGLQEKYNQHNYILFAPKASNSAFFDPYSINFEIIQPKVKFLWRSFGLGRDISKAKIDLYHGLSHELPFDISRSRCKTVVTIHDVIFKSHPLQYRSIDRLVYDRKWRYACDSADGIIAISEATKHDLTSFYGIDPAKIKVIYQSCAPAFQKKQESVQISDYLNSNELPKEYLLYVGSVIPRKNLLNTLKGLRQADVKIPLIIVGNMNTKYASLVKDYIRQNDMSPNIFYANPTSDQQLAFLYQGALGLLYLSMKEGFGLPVIEALFSGTPVITSNLSSLPEAAGPSSILVNPLAIDEISQAIEEVVNEDQTTRIVAGLQYAQQNFSLDKFVTKTMAFYNKLLEKGSK